MKLEEIIQGVAIEEIKGDIKKFHHIFIPKEIHILELKRSLNTRGYLQKKEKSILTVQNSREQLRKTFQIH